MSSRPSIMQARRRGGVVAGMAPPTHPPDSEKTPPADEPSDVAHEPAVPVEPQPEPKPKPKPRAAARPTAKTAAKAKPAADMGAVARVGRPRLDGDADSGTAAAASEDAPIRFGGARKASVTTRTYPPLWERFAVLANDLTREGRGRVYQADIINAVLAVGLPKTNEEAREVLAQYEEMLRADPPSDLRRV